MSRPNNTNMVPDTPRKIQIENEPLYQTTVPYPPTAPEVPPRPPNLFSPFKSPKKGILKNGSSPKHKATKLSSSSPVILEKKTLSANEDVGHFDLTVHEEKYVTSKDPNQTIQKIPKHKGYTSGRRKRKKEPKPFPSDWAEKGARAARAESISGIIHLLVIILSIVTVAMMAKLTSEWETKRRRCPLYVKNTPNVDIYWGNEKMAPCHYGSFMPVLIIIMSFTLIIFHGGILWSWRSGGDVSKVLLSKTYPKVIFFLEFFEFIVALTVAGVLTDGFRQTCVGFQLSPWQDERPENCKAGYYERDDAYDISKTYSRIVGSIATSWISAILLLSSSFLFFRRAKICSNTKF